nr:CMT1A duplicated region transcript 15 protein-like protein [Aotus nancymaae]
MDTELKLLLHMQQHRNFQYCSARTNTRGRAPSGTALELEDALEPSRPCPGTAKDKPNEDLPAILAPAVATGLSPRAERVAGARGGREGVASMAPVSSYDPAPHPGHSGNHGGRDPGMQPGFLCLAGDRLLALS